MSTIRSWKAHGLVTRRVGRSVRIERRSLFEMKRRMDFLNPKMPKKAA